MRCTLAWVMCFVVGLFDCYCLRLLIAFDVYGCGYLVVRYWVFDYCKWVYLVYFGCLVLLWLLFG